MSTEKFEVTFTDSGLTFYWDLAECVSHFGRAEFEEIKAGYLPQILCIELDPRSETETLSETLSEAAQVLEALVPAHTRTDLIRRLRVESEARPIGVNGGVE